MSHDLDCAGPTMRLTAKSRRANGSEWNADWVGLATAQTACHIQCVSIKLIERQLTDLQNRVVNLEAQVKGKPRDAWKQIIGTSKGQGLDREAARLGAEWRAKENKRK